MPDPLSPDLLQKMHAYWRAENYLSVGRIYLAVACLCALTFDACTRSRKQARWRARLNSPGPSVCALPHKQIPARIPIPSQ